MKDYDLKCFFQPIPTNPPRAKPLKNYSSKILKNKTCPDDDFICIYSTTSYLFTNQQIGCYTPEIPINDQADFNDSVDYYVTLAYGENFQITCEKQSDCKVTFNTKNTSIMNYFNANNFYAGYTLSLRVDQKSNSIGDLVDIKVKIRNLNLKIFF